MRDKVVLAEAEKVAAEMMARVRDDLARIVRVLEARDYAFAAGSAKKALPAPSAKAAAAIASLEKALGVPLPIALRAFYEVVGEVNLCEDVDAVPDDDAPFAGYGRLNPLVIVSPRAALDPLENERAFQARYPPELRLPFARVYLGPNPRHKSEPSVNEDDLPYRLEVRDEGADAIVVQGGKETPFVDYLRDTVLSGGFAALTDASRRAALTRGSSPF